MLSVTYKPLMLSVIMLNVVMLTDVMLNVVAPSMGKIPALTENIRLGWKSLSYLNKYSGLFLQIAIYNVFEKFGYLIQKISLYC